MTYTIDTAYSHGVPTIENQRKLIKGEFDKVTDIIFRLTSRTYYDKYTFSVETPLTPVIDKKRSGKDLGEKLIERLVRQLISKCDKSKVLNVESPTEKSPCLSVYEDKGEIKLKAEISFTLE